MATAPCLMAPPTATVSLFAPPVIAILVILGVALLLLLYYTLLSRLRHVDTSDVDSSVFQVETTIWPTLRGLDKAAVRLIPIFHYSKKEEGGGTMGEGTECAVCLVEFREAESLRVLPKCGHAFHIPCIDQWLRSHSNCPLCRAPLSPLSTTS